MLNFKMIKLGEAIPRIMFALLGYKYALVRLTGTIQRLIPPLALGCVQI